MSKRERLRYRLKVGAVVAGGFAITFAETTFWIWGLVIGGIILALIEHPASGRLVTARGTATAAKKAFESELEDYQRLTQDPRITELYNRLASTKARLDGLPAEYQRGMQELHKTVRQRQLEMFLDRYLISDAGIDGIGPARVTALASFNIETARDVEYHSVMRVQGFGEALTARLLAWRRGIEGRFTFDPSRGVPQQDVIALTGRLANERAQSEKALRDGLMQLVQLHSAASGLRGAVKLRLDSASLALAQAEADLTALQRA